jgi:hypothetical protein
MEGAGWDEVTPFFGDCQSKKDHWGLLIRILSILGPAVEVFGFELPLIEKSAFVVQDGNI